MICIYCLQIRHFLDFTPDGPLCHMLSTMYQFKNEQGWRRFDLSSPSRKDANLEMCQKVEEVLEKKRFHVNPKLFLHKDLTKEDKEKVTKFHPHPGYRGVLVIVGRAYLQFTRCVFTKFLGVG